MPIPEKFIVSLHDDTTGKSGQITLEIERQSEETLSDIAARLIPLGARQFARQIAVQNAGSEEEIDGVVARLKTDDFCKEGEKTFFLVDGQYSDKMPWSDRIEAVDEEDAAFGARWIMSINEGGFPDGDDLDNFIENMSEQEIFSCTHDPVAFDELVDMVRAHVAALNGDRSALDETGAALADALEKIDAANPAIDAGAAPKRDDSPTP